LAIGRLVFAPLLPNDQGAAHCSPGDYIADRARSHTRSDEASGISADDDTVIALGLAPLVLLGAERILDADPSPSPGSRLVLGTAAGATVTCWLHSWTGAGVLLVIAAAALTRRLRRRDAIILIPLIAGGLPIAYLFLLTKLDAAWKVAERMNDRPDLVVLTPHSFSGPHDVSKHFLPFGAKAEGFHLKEFSFTDMDEFLRRAGFQDVLGFPFHPRLLGKYHLTPKPSEWAARKSMMLEKIAKRGPLPKLLRLGRTSARIVTALAFPAVAVGAKRRSKTLSNGGFAVTGWSGTRPG